MLGYFRAKGLERQCTFETGKPHVMVSINTANLEYQYIYYDKNKDSNQ